MLIRLSSQTFQQILRNSGRHILTPISGPKFNSAMQSSVAFVTNFKILEIAEMKNWKEPRFKQSFINCSRTQTDNLHQATTYTVMIGNNATRR